MSIPLRPYQRDALDAIAEAGRRGVTRQLVAQATGTGKTVLAAHLIAAQTGRSLFLCHRDELIAQTVAKLAEVAPHLEPGIVRASSDETDAQVVVASVATLARPQRLARLGRDFELVIADEAHHTASPTWQRVLAHLDGAALRIGLTATPQRGDGLALTAFDEITHEYPILRGIREGYLCDLTGQIAGTDADLSRVSRHGGDFTASSLGEELSRSGALPQIVDAWCEHAPERHTLAFTPSVSSAYELADEFTARGIAAEAFDGSTSQENRRGVLHRFHRGQLHVLVNCAVLTEGYDEPAADCILLARPTQSEVLYRQIVGRGARTYPGKTDCLVLDVTGISSEHELMGLASLGGLEAGEIQPGQGLREAADEAESAAGQRRRLRRARRSEAVDLFARSRLNWLRLDGALVLPVGPKAVVMIPVDEQQETWAVATAERGRLVEILGERLSLGYAEGIGEDYARTCGSLARTDGRWRRSAPSEKQRALLNQMGLADTASVRDRGHASDLITLVSARPAIHALRTKAVTV